MHPDAAARPQKHKSLHPLYFIFKIKSIQDIDIQKLTGSISCVIIHILIEDLTEPIVHLLETGMVTQVTGRVDRAWGERGE